MATWYQPCVRGASPGELLSTKVPPLGLTVQEQSAVPERGLRGRLWTKAKGRSRRTQERGCPQGPAQKWPEALAGRCAKPLQPRPRTARRHLASPAPRLPSVSASRWQGRLHPWSGSQASTRDGQKHIFVRTLRAPGRQVVKTGNWPDAVLSR